MTRNQSIWSLGVIDYLKYALVKLKRQLSCRRDDVARECDRLIARRMPPTPRPLAPFASMPMGGSSRTTGPLVSDPSMFTSFSLGTYEMDPGQTPYSFMPTPSGMGGASHSTMSAPSFTELLHSHGPLPNFQALHEGDFETGADEVTSWTTFWRELTGQGPAQS